MTWQIKASTRCNLRCRYCYEWDRLDDRRRLTLPQWRHILQAATDYRALAEQRWGAPVGTHIVLHGGEPLLLPLWYLQSVFALQREILGADVLQSIQTNLTVLPGHVLEWLRRENVLLGVSWDGSSGARVDLADRPTEQRVIANLRRLKTQGVRFGVTLVLGSHNHHDLPAIYDQLEALAAEWLNVVPLFLSTTPATAALFQLSLDDSYHALVTLFEHWRNVGRRLSIQPIVDSVWTIHYRQMCEQRPPRDGTRFIVHADGDVSVQAGTASKAVAIGNLFDRSIRDILSSGRYAAELARANALRKVICSTCLYRGACDAGPILRYPHGHSAGPCPLESRLCDYIDSFLRRSRSTALELLGWSSASLHLMPGPQVAWDK